MKMLIKRILYILIFILIIFILPAICTKKIKNKEENKENEIIELKKHDYSKYGTIKLLHKKSGQIEEISIDEYLYGVVSAEMPANYEEEALKAQAVAARTYTIYQISNNNGKHKNADICDDSTCCQAWISKENRMNRWSEEERENNWNKIVKAVNSTAGKIITYNNEAINAFFHSNSGGKTEIPSNVWIGGKDFPYLRSVETSGEDGYSQYSSEVKISKADLLEKLKKEYSDIQINFDENESIKILEYTQSGRVKTVKFGNTEIAGTKVRSVIGLKSTNFSIKIDGDNVIFSVTGYGHGVGMSQTGADSMAKKGKTYEEILKHFYNGVEITTI